VQWLHGLIVLQADLMALVRWWRLLVWLSQVPMRYSTIQQVTKEEERIEEMQQTMFTFLGGGADRRKKPIPPDRPPPVRAAVLPSLVSLSLLLSYEMYNQKGD
jgi:hypothetical protein